MEPTPVIQPFDTPQRRGTFQGLLLCLLISGGSALIYEIAWVRSLELVFGATSFAVATVLAAFMGGLALGSWLMGIGARRLERFHPLRIYATIEGLIGISGLLVPFALRALVPLYQTIWERTHASFALFSFCRLVLCGAILLVPTALMGATLPIASRLATAGPRVGWLYACNTLGAVFGCSAAGLALLPAIGLRRTEWLAVGLNLIAAAGALLLERWSAAHPASEPAVTSHHPPAETTSAAPNATALIVLYAISGAVAMVYEVAWSRLLVLVLGSSTYSYTIMLTTFLAGLAIGAGLGARLFKSRFDPLLAAALCQVLVALTTYAGLFLVKELPFLYVVAYDHLQPSPRGLLAVQLAFASGLMILPTLGLGAMFPATIAGLRPAGGAAPRVVGRLYAWNTFGAILGSIAAGFWLVPRLGSREALLVGVAISALLGLCGFSLASSVPRGRIRLLFALSVSAFLANLVVAAPVLPPDVMSTGVFRYADRYRGSDRTTFLERSRVNHGEILMFKEGLTCTVTVFRTTSARTLLVNGKPDASVPPGLSAPLGRSLGAKLGDLSTQVLVGQLPLLLAPRRDRVLVAGLGSGVTLGSTLTHPVKEVDCVELEEAVVQGSRFFDDESRAPLDDPRVRLVVNDARNHLLLGGAPYDVIISEPSNPWVAGAAGLFTKDFFALARTRLASDGLFCQWLQLYEMTSDDFRAILRGFTASFPEVHIFRVAADAILVGSAGPIPVQPEAILTRLGGRIAPDLARIGILSPEDLLAHHWIGGAELTGALRPGPFNTDDNMLIEFAAPLRMLSQSAEARQAQAADLAGMFAGLTSGIAPHLIAPAAERGSSANYWARASGSTLAAGYTDLAASYAARSLELERTPEAARLYGEALALGGRPEAARPWLEAAARDYPRHAGVRRALVALERRQKDWAAVRRDAPTLVKLDPGDRRARYWLGEGLYRLGEHDAAFAALAPLAAIEKDSAAGSGAAAARGPQTYDDLPDLGLFLGALESAACHHAEAIAPFREYLRTHPTDRKVRGLLAYALDRAGRVREARAEWRRLSPDAPRRAAERMAQAEIRWNSGRRESLSALLEEAREFDPDSDPIAFLLARSYVRRGDRARASALAEEFLDSHPDCPWAVGYLGQIAEADGRGDVARLLAQRYKALTGREWEPVAD